jgi:nicotinate phosphoribosyltransferase
MMQVAWRNYRDAQVKYEFFERDTGHAAPVGTYLNAYGLRTAFINVQSMKLSNEDLRFLRDTNMFEEDFLDALMYLDLPPVDVNIDPNGNLSISTTGQWWKVMLWETIILSTVNEQYNAIRVEQSGRNPVEAISDGITRLYGKLERMQHNFRAYDFTLSDFGTRRRYSHEWQGLALDLTKKALPSSMVTREGNPLFAGTSNVYWAKTLGLKPIGTYAHEMDMVYAGLYYPIKPSELELAHRYMMRDWESQYPYAMRIGLTDTWGSDFFFRNFSKEQSINWAGVRHDSGDPYEFIRRVVDHYKLLGIDPKTKRIVFSDGLNADEISRILHEGWGKIQMSFGWGTDLMNDCGILPRSLVVKATRADYNPLVKLSDNLNKAIGSELDIAAYVNMAHYVPQERKELTS